MVQLLVGENSFEIERELQRIIASVGARVERIDGSEIELRQIPDLLMGVSLFAEKRLVVIKNLSENKSIWGDFGDWLPRLSDDIQLVLVEPKPDKRTKTFKELKKNADIKEFHPWGERDSYAAEQWAIAEAQQLGCELSTAMARQLVGRTGVDQWRVFHALEKLSLLDAVTPEAIDETIERSPSENVFALFETALRGDAVQVRESIATLELTEEAYKVFGLLSGQVFQLAALVAIDEPSGDIAKDIGAHPFVLSKLAPYAKKLHRKDARRIVGLFSDADREMKSSATDPWLLIERALVKTATIAH